LWRQSDYKQQAIAGVVPLWSDEHAFEVPAPRLSQGQSIGSIVEDMRRAIMPLLLLLLVGLQAYAGVCGVRCGGRELAQNSAPAMARCRAMSMDHGARATKPLLSAPNSCTEVCQSDLKLLQSRHNLDGQLPAVGIVCALDLRVPLPGYARAGRFSVERSPQSIPSLYRLVFNLRI